MTTSRLLAIVVLIPFTLLTLLAIAEVGYVGIFDYQRHSIAGWQVFIDLVIALMIVLAWMIPHAREHGRNPWPWVAATFVAGSLAPLAYLAFAPRRQSQRDSEQGASISH